MRMLLRDLSPGTQYSVQLRSTSDAASSEWSRKFTVATSIDGLAPAAPTSPAIVLSGAEAALSWNAVTTNADGSPITDLLTYRISVKSPSAGGSYTKDVGLATKMEFSLDTNRKTFGTPRGSLYFEISAVDTVGNVSALATSPTVTTPAPPNVTGFTAVAGQSLINLKWNSLTLTTLQSYKIYQGTTSGFALTTPVAEVTGNAYTFPTTSYGADLYFRIVATDVFGVSSVTPAQAGPVRPENPFTIDTTAPGVPSGLTAVITGNSMKVSWTALGDTDMKYYIVSYRKVGDADWTTQNVPYDQTTAAIPVEPGTNYNVRIRATDFVSNMSNYSAIVTTTTATVNTAPAVPTGLAMVAGRDNLQISWNENTEVDMKGNVGTYDVTVATNSGFTTGVLQYRTGATTLSINGLSTGTPYWVRVRATDNGNPPLSSAYSTSVTATTGQFPATPLSDGNAPASSPVAVATGGFGYIHASWTPIANNDMVTYEVHLGTTTGFVASGSTKVSEIAGSTTVIENTAAGAALAYGTSYYVKIIAKDRDGAASASAASNVVQITKVGSTDTTITPADIGAATQTDLNNKYNTALKSSVVEYSVHSSETVAPTTGWSSSTPTRTPGTFIWYRTVLTYGDNTTSTSSPALLTGNTGSTGAPGTNGAPAAFITLTATTQVLTSPAAGGATSPTTSVITGTATNTTITAWTYSVNGAAFSATVPAGVSRTGNVVTITGSTMTAKTITVKMADANGVADTLTAAKVFDGATGSTGAPGTNGTPGAAGADAYTVILSNEAQVFSGSVTSANAGSATSSVIAYKGSVQSVATIGTITGQVTGLTTAITNNGTANATVTVTVTTSLTALNGILTIPVTVDGKTFTKTFSWSVSRQGATGSQGIQGNPGADGVTTYTWLKYADTPTTGMNDSPVGKTYMGIATNKTTSTESSTYSDYTWSLIKGTDGSPGVPGTPGADGVTTYTWVKYATSAAGAGLSDDPTGKTYIGLAFNKTTATESTTVGDYQWSLIQGPQGDTGNTGAPGTPAEMVYLTATSQVLTSSATGGATSPTTAVVTGASVNGAITVWQYSTNGAAFTNTLPAGVTRSGNVVTITGSTVTANTITVRMATSSGVSDTLTVAKVSNGAQGATGNTGSPGAAGADAYTVILSNEAHSFAGSTTAALAGSTTSTVIAYKGSAQQSATVGTITGQVTGLTTSIASNGTTAPVITITVTTALTTRNGTLTVPVTVDGKVFTKTIAWAVAYAGATGSTGSPGTPGSNGISVTSVTPYFQTVTKGAAAPAAPTIMTPPGPWSATEPSYTTNTELYRTDRVVYSNSTFSYSSVTKVAAYSGLEAVTADAQVKANAARDAAIDAASGDATDKANTAQSNAIASSLTEINNLRTLALNAAANAANLIVNPSFEAGLDGWTKTGTVNILTSRSRTGSSSAAFGGTSDLVSNALPVTPGETYRIGLFVWAISTTGVAGGLRLQTSTNGTTWVTGSGGGWSEANNAANSSDWVLQERDYTVQTGVKFIRLRVASALSAGTVYIDDTYIKDITESKRLEAVAAAVENRTLSRGTDLVTNGTASMGDNTNFSQFTLDKTDAPNGAAGSFDSLAPGVATTRVADEFLPVDTNKRFMFSFQAKQKGTTTGGYMYSGVIPYDAYKLQISPQHTMYIPGTLTTLASPLNPGDTTITIVAPSTAWYGSAGKNAGASTHLRSIIWWDYTDEGGKLWGPETYSRNWSGSNYWADGAISGNVITLNVPYSGPVRPAGTKLSNGSSGGTYMYGGTSNTIIPKEWTGYSATITGVITGGGGPSFANGWPIGTAYAKIRWLTDRQGNGTSDTLSKHSIAAVSFSDASAANYAANNITSTQITDYAITTPKIATDAINARTVIAGAIGTVALAAEAVDATKIKADSINATHVAIGDTSNMATVNESVAGQANYGYNHIITNGWSTRDVNTGIYFIFRPATGPVTFKTGDRIRVTFEAYATTAVATPMSLWVYGNATDSQPLGTASLTTTAQTFTFESNITVDTNLKTSYVMGMHSVAAKDVFLRNVRVYRMGAGELIVDGTIHGNKMITNTLDANVIKTSTLTSTTITLGAGGKIVTNTGGVQLTDSGIIIPSGTLDANILKANTSFITTLNIGAGGAVQSAGYNGTSGFKLSNTGLVIKGANNTVDGGAVPNSTLDVNSIKTSSLTATTISLGANGNISVGVGGKITVDGSTGAVQSNNFFGTTTGWQLGYQGLVINDGSVDASTLRANSAIINEVTIGATNTGPGAIKSKDYVANSAGFKLSTAGLEINKGSISAEALRLQIGRNQMHPAYADFEFETSYYTGKIAGFFGIGLISTAQAKFGTKSLLIAWTGNAGANIPFAASDVDYNVRIDPSMPQIVSMWVFQPDVYALQIGIKANRTSGGAIDSASPNISVGTGWQRIQFEWTPPALATGDIVVSLRSNGASSGKLMYVDGIQVEERTGAVGTGASTYFPPSTTTIDGGAINTGSIRSSALNSRSEPFWSINMSGNAVFNRALIQEELIVGNPSALSNYAEIKSVNFVTGVSGWRIDSTGALEANNGIFRGSIETSSLKAELKIATGGKIVSGNATGARVETSSDGVRVFTIGPNKDAYEATTLTHGEISIGVMRQDGTRLAGISPDGAVTGVTGKFNDEVRVKGTPLLGKVGGGASLGWLDNYPLGLLRSGASSTSTSADAAERVHARVTVSLKPERWYRVVAWVNCNVQSTGAFRAQIRYTTGNGQVSTSSSTLGEPTTSGTPYTSGINMDLTTESFYSVTTPTKVQFAVTYRGLGGMNPAGRNSRIYVEDIGLRGSITPGEETESTIYESIWKATASRRYNKAGAAIAGSDGSIDVWYWHGTPTDFQSSAILFGGNVHSSTDSLEYGKSLPVALNGATISRVQIYLRNKVWYGGPDSGTFVLGSLGASSIPANKTDITGTQRYDDLGSGEGAWFDLPVINGSWFLNGAQRGVTIGDKTGEWVGSPDTGMDLTSGAFHGISDTDPPLLKVSYSR